MARIGVSGMVRANSGIGVIQRMVYPLLSDGVALVTSKTRDVDGPLSTIRGLLYGLLPPVRRLDGYLCLTSPVPFLAPKPLVVVIHDVRWLNTGSRLKKAYRQWDLARTAKLATKIICVSDQTRRAFLALHPNAAEKTEAVWLGPGLIKEGSWADPVVGRTLLIDGDPRKRNDLAGRVIGELPPGIVQSIVGIGIGQAAQNACRKAIGADHLKFLSLASEDEMRMHFQEAQFYVHLGVDEGFGLPFIEALTSGAVVVAVDQPLTREVLGDNAILLPDSDNAAVLAHAWMSQAEPSVATRKLWARQFSWSAFANAIRQGLNIKKRG